ncbi:hypothetical protein RRG08_032078 [Elysia crispata]|uniref:Transmembrane protein 260 n=1 Tax=Elysia crispata TaxID=231223 RepID=A0AAE0ZGN1_9GAST|nr:hypothetical protein RRG08_032078 [Elysia crispata]
MATGRLGNSRKISRRVITSYRPAENVCDEKRTNSKSSSENETKQWKYQIAISVSLVTFAVYVRTLHPSLPGGDSGELVVAAHDFGVSHPPGYPLFTLLSMCVLHVIPVGSPIWKINILSATFGAIASGIIYIIIYRLCSNHGAGLVGSFMFSLSPLVWTWSGCAEVFSLNNFLLAALLLTAVEFDIGKAKNRIKLSYVGSFLCGLCLSNQHTSVLYIVFLVPWVMLRLWKLELLSLDSVLKVTVAFMLGLIPYLYLPISSIANVARWTWGDQSSLNGFITHLLRQEYGTWDLLKDHSGQGFIHGMQSYLTHIAADLSVLVSSFAALSMWITAQRYKTSGSSVLVIFTAMVIGYNAFFCWRANLDMSNPLFLKVVERFWIQSDLVVVVLASVSFADVYRLFSERFNLKGYSFHYFLMMPLLALQLHRSLTLCNNSNNTVVRDFALQSLAVFPNNSIILTKGDLPSNSYRYFHFCEGVRPDLTIFDQEILTYRWSLPMTRKFYPGIHFPGNFLHMKKGVVSNGQKSFTFLDLIDANYNRPIFACIGVQEYESSWKKSYDLWPYSVCWKIIKKGESLDIDQWEKKTEHLAEHWHYAPNSFESGSWESVANDEMWRAKSATAMFYLDVALKLPENSTEYFELLLHSYQLLSRAMKQASRVSPTNSSDDVPSYWHRNFAIVCERLIRRSSTDQYKKNYSNSSASLPDQITLVRLTNHHFKQFLRLEPFDPDYKNIKEAINTLQGYLDNKDKKK